MPDDSIEAGIKKKLSGDYISVPAVLIDICCVVSIPLRRDYSYYAENL